jgi:N-6 DNA methylase
VVGGSTTVSAAGIAKLAGVGRAAVSNWRRRYRDFPEPVGGSATSPVFELAEVERWLHGQGKLAELSPRELVWRRFRSSSGSSDLAEMLCFAGALLFARGNGDERVPAPSELAEAIAVADRSAAEFLSADFPVEWSQPQRDVLAAVAELAVRQEPGEVFEFLFTQYVAARGAASDYTTPPDLASLMVELAGPATSVLDFACGMGTLIDSALGTGSHIDCFAQDIDPVAVRITQLRLLFAHRTATVSGGRSVVRLGDSLLADAFPGLQVDVVLANPPFGLHNWGHDRLAYDPRWEFGGLPPKTEPELAWVQHALAHLHEGGYAVLLMPPAAAQRPAGRRIRAELLRRGALRAVIGLPPKLLPYTAIALHLWILQRPVEGERVAPCVLFVDTAAEPGTMRDTAFSAWRAFRKNPALVAAEPGVRAVVPVIDLLDDATDLTPQLYLPLPDPPHRDPADLLTAYETLDTELGGLLAKLPSMVVEGASPLGGARLVSVEQLMQNGDLVLHRTTSPVPGSSIDQKAVTGHDVARGVPPSGVATAGGNAVRAGDVLIPQVGGQLLARVATADQVGAQLSATVQALRPNVDILDPWFLAGVLSRRENERIVARHPTTSSGRMRIDVKRLRVPLPPIDVQRRYGEAFRRIVEFETSLARVSDLGRLLARGLADGLATGALDADLTTPRNSGDR